ncbi:MULTISPECIES: helix-turn-helix domain-containing protein [Nonomuraea]|uniref:Helix-turn-helix domain-containing protein n=1 Tax=Nonomuraea ferruginea TaxID=46174 RepID=A0ABT4ST78_9ACTN|nr:MULTISPECIES: helix-turn-helix domain-containing protein [Nonomuraea]MDA0640203.1 helix-turn-helix domain-containing protein [Nonomuraea ferruginea]TXK43201.1 helix-turn-helix domain-containing protein [Nonomuraea sp. C10]
MDSAELKERVRELRAEGRSPKEIARALKVPPSAVAPLVRAIAAENAGGGDDREAELIGCWMSVGWSNGLGVDPARGWTDEAPDAEGGKVSVLVVRRHNWDKLTVVGCLADVYCTGIKHIIGPDVVDERELRRFREFFFSDYKGFQEVPVELARHLVFGADDYARSLGVESHEEIGQLSGLLGDWEGPSAITFGRRGRPYYVPDTYDDPQKVVHILRRKLSYDEFDYDI